MEDYTLRVPDNNDNALALLNYLKTLDFVELTKTRDWWDELSEGNKKSIQKGLDDIENGRVHSDKEIRASVRQRILKAKMG